MPRLAWTPESRIDLRDIRDYIRQSSPLNAERFVTHLIAATNRLERHPMLGQRPFPEDRPDVREILCGNYRIVYRAGRHRTDILRVIHAARLFDVGMIE